MKNRPLIYLILAAAFLLLTNLVYINYALHATPDYRYTGANPHAAADKLVYMSMIQQGREGQLFMKNLHTTDPQQGLLLSPHWYVIGQTANLLNISNNASYQSYRVIFIILFLILIYVVLGKLFRKDSRFNLAAAFIFFTGGVGWYILLKFPAILTSTKGQIKFLFAPTDLYVTEGNTLLNFSQSPLFALSQLTILFIFYLFVRNRHKLNLKVDLLILVLAAFLILIHPYNAPVIFAVLGSWSVWYFYQNKDWLIFKKFLLVALGGAIGLAYNIYLLYAEPVIAEWLKQNLVYSPPLKQYLLGYGLLIPFWILGFILVLKRKRNDPWWMLFLIWSGVIWLLLYLPLDINRRFVNGWHIALAIISSYGFYYLYQKCLRRWLKVSFALVAFFILISSLGFFLFVSLFFSRSAYTYGYYYVTNDEANVIEWLRRNSELDDNILTSDMKTSFTIVSQLNRSVFRGHDHQTPEVLLKQQQMDWFFSSNQGVESLRRKRAFLANNKLEYIVVNANRLKQDVNWLDQADWLDLELQSDGLSVYKVI